MANAASIAASAPVLTGGVVPDMQRDPWTAMGHFLLSHVSFQSHPFSPRQQGLNPAKKTEVMISPVFYINDESTHQTVCIAKRWGNSLGFRATIFTRWGKTKFL